MSTIVLPKAPLYIITLTIHRTRYASASARIAVMIIKTIFFIFLTSPLRARRRRRDKTNAFL